MTGPDGAAATGERRRRSTQGARRRTGFLAQPPFGRRLFLAMAALAIGYAGVTLYGIVHAARNYGAAYLGMSRAEVRYIFGSPALQARGDSLWRMRAGDATLSFLFDADDRLAAVGCRAPAGGSGGDCPDTFGLRLGDSDVAVWGKLGVPTAESYADDSKIMTYPALGVRLKLRRTAIVAIEHRRVSGVVPFAVRAISLLAP